MGVLFFVDQYYGLDFGFVTNHLNQVCVSVLGIHVC